MKIGILSDTHDNLKNTSKALDFFEKKGIELLIHCGDWVQPFTMRIFTKLNCPIKCVMGNGDPDVQKFQYQIQNQAIYKGKKFEFQERMQDFEIGDRRIAIFHGNDDNVNNLIIKSQFYDVFCLGHSHEAEIKKVGKTIVINPGAMLGYTAEEGEIPIYVAIYDTQTNKAQLYKV